jgi:acetyl-CoA carboxylase biotin carboxylase subunit
VSGDSHSPPVILVANRGEIAMRIIAAVRRIGGSPVLAASSADADSPAARAADRVVIIGAAPASQSYLRPEYVAQAAVQAGAVAVHPGYGFLSEQPRLAELLEEEGIAFVGPRIETLRAVGDKGSARRVAIDAQVPVAAGAEIDDPNDSDAIIRLSESIGFPLLIKAIHGGGGRGIRLVTSTEELVALVPQAAAEAETAFGNGALYLERFYPAAREPSSSWSIRNRTTSSSSRSTPESRWSIASPKKPSGSTSWRRNCASRWVLILNSPTFLLFPRSRSSN